MHGWDQWIQLNASDGGLLQSTVWAEFQRALGRRVEWFELGGTVRALVIEQCLPFGQTYVYSPRGPVVENREDRIENREQELKAIVEEVRKKFPKAIFWRIEPLIPFQISDFRFQIAQAPHAIQPTTTLIVDLSKSEEVLLAQMKQKTRYNIHIAQKNSIVVRNIENLEIFLDLLEETATRDGFRTHSREYYKALLNNDNRSVELFGVFNNDQLLAGAIIAFFGTWAYYLHGASSSQRREVMAPYVLHWEVMREAKRRGCTQYDFWGAGDQWPGVSKFKTGFAPATPLTRYPGTLDVVL